VSAPRIFISYRRTDSAGHAGRLYDALSMRFGDDRVFMDIDQIPIASDFRQVIADALARTDLVLVVIGPSWLSITDRDGRRRLDDPADLVRLEIVESLRRNVRVLPVLVEGAHMPAAEDLPEPLAPLARIQALELSDRRWRSDLEEFLEAVAKERWGRAEDEGDSRPEPRVPPVGPGRRPGPARAWWAGGAAVCAVVILVAIVLALGGDDDGGDGGGDGGGAANGTTTSAPTPAPANKIVFSNVDSGGVMKVNGDGTQPVTLTSDGTAPAPSPDGTRIAFERVSDGNRDIYVMDADGSNARRLTTAAGDDIDPSWSPDGRSIVFESRRDGNSEIYVMAVDSLRQTRLTEHPATDSDPTFSPDGGFIAFDSDRPGNREIYRMTATGTDIRRLTTRAEQDSDAAWSPDGALIAFEAERGPNFDIFVMAPDGSGLRQLTEDPAYDFNPDWSPDGRQLVFTRGIQASRGLYVMNADGSGQRRLADVPAGDPDWGAR
jgi:Tol biopolymer transport system component